MSAAGQAGARERACPEPSLSDLTRDELLRATEAAAAHLAEAADPGARAWGAGLAALRRAEVTRTAISQLLPPAPRGGSHGRSEGVRRAPEILQALRRQLALEHVSNSEAARQIRGFIESYHREQFARNRQCGMFPNADSPHYFAHYLIGSGALIRGGGLISAEHIARLLGSVCQSRN